MRRGWIIACIAGMVSLAVGIGVMVMWQPPETKIAKTEVAGLTISLADGTSSPPLKPQRFAGPYAVRSRAPETAFDQSKAEDVLDALWSTPNRDPEKYLTFLDEGAQAQVRQVDKESGGKLLAPSMKGEPFPGPDKYKVEFLHTVDTEIGGKTYRIFVGRQFVDGKEYNGLTMVLVKSGARWLQSFDLDKTALLTEVGLRSYHELVKPQAAQPSSAAIPRQ